MRYLSVCSGIEAASVAWRPLGWEPVAFAETDPHASAVLKHHFGDVTNMGDFTKIEGDEYGTIDLVVGGTPCQSFSIAGKREGLDDTRGHLSLEFAKIVGRTNPKWFVWENVPGVMSMDKGRSLGAIFGALEKCGYCFAWRILDAQHVRTHGFPRAVPQRRRRLFVVGYLGDWRPPAAVLFDTESLSGNPPPRRQAGQKTSYTLTRNLGTGGFNNPDVTVVNSKMGGHPSIDVSLPIDANLPAHTVSAKWAKGTGGPSGDECQNLVSVSLTKSHGNGYDTDAANSTIIESPVLRRITPTESERLQGFPDGYTLVPYQNRMMADSHRYKMIGNSMAVNVMQWLGERITLYEDLKNEN